MAVGEIILWLIIGIAIGFAIAWVLRKRLLDGALASETESLKEAEEEPLRKLRKELATAKSEAAGFSSDLEARTSELEHRTADLERANALLAEHKKSAATAAADLRTYRSAASKLENKIADRESTIASLREKASGAIPADEVQRQLDGANGTIGALRKDAEGYQATIASLRIDLDRERRDKTNLTDQLESSDSKLATVATALEASRDNAKNLQGRLTELEAAVTKSGDHERQVNALSAQLADANEQIDLTMARLREVEADHAECASKIAAATEGPVEFPADPSPEPEPESELEPEPEPAPEPAPEPEPEPAEVLPEKDVAVAKVAEIATRTRGSGPAVEDDLKKIHGVGPKLEGLLKSMDITSFRQVAAFTADDIQYVTAALDAFPGRIERDDWMSSAAEEHSKKYGEPV